MECWTTITGILTTITTGTATPLQTRRASHTRIGIATSR